MAREAWGALALLAALLVLAQPLAATPPTPGTGEDPQAAAELGLHDREGDLSEPLHQLARSPAEHAAIAAGYDAGRDWATRTMSAAGPADLADAIAGLYQHRGVDAAPAAAELPDGYAGPLTVLVSLAGQGPADAVPAAAGPGAQASARQAFTLGAVDVARSALDAVLDRAPEEPVFVDPMGLVIVGGNGDDTYQPRTVAGSWWSGAMVVVEPGGNDTYEVPVAAETNFDPDRDPQEPPPGGAFQEVSIGLEFEGNDSYNERVAATPLGDGGLLVDEQGDDDYGSTSLPRSVAYASPGFAFLNDEEGDDVYRAEKRGVAFAHGGRAVLWDEHGADRYELSTDSGYYGMAAAMDLRASVLLKDEIGDDEYRADLFAFGYSRADSVARFSEEQGDDLYRVFSPDSSFGFRLRGAGTTVFEGPVNRGLGTFVDGNGTDLYEWESSDDPFVPTNDDTHVRHDFGHKWGVFVDCETGPDDRVPCEDEQRNATREVAANP